MFVLSFVFLLCSAFHPFYLSVTELHYDKAERRIQVSCKIFTDDFENALRKNTSSVVDLLNPKDQSKMDALVSDYISRNLRIVADGKIIVCKFLGYEKEEEAIWSYFESETLAQPRQLEVYNSILYDYKTEQINIVQVSGMGRKQSSKTAWPEKKMSFDLK